MEELERIVSTCGLESEVDGTIMFVMENCTTCAKKNKVSLIRQKRVFEILRYLGKLNKQKRENSRVHITRTPNMSEMSIFGQKSSNLPCLRVK